MKNPDRIVIQASATPAAPARRALKRRSPAPLVLEQRIMFDGAAVDTAVAARAAAAEHAAADGAAAERAAAEKAAAEVKVPAAVAPATGEQPRHEIVFIEDNVVNLQQLVAGVRDGVEVVVLDHTRDGLTQMLAALKGHAPVDAIHLVTHGSAGQIELGSTISNANIEQYRDQFAQLGQSLTAGGDLLIYGCDVAEGANGLAFVDRLAELTQADVAASVDVTGSRAFNGNWTLETQHGAIETAAMALDRAGWQGQLVTQTVYDANWQALNFNGTIGSGLTSISGSGNGRSTGDVMRFNSVITISGQAIDAVVTTTLDRATLSSTGYDSTSQPSPNTEYFQPNMNVTAPGGGVTFTIDFYKAGTYTGAGTGTAVTLQNVAVNSYDIDGFGSNNSDRQYQQFKGFSRYELSNNTFLVPTTQADGSVTFQYVSASGVNNGPIAQDEYRVKVYYDSMSSFQIKSGVNTAGNGSLQGTAHFALDFSLGPAWGTETTIVDSPAPRLTYSTTNFTEATANDGSFTMSSTITLSGGSSTFSGSNGVLSDVTFSNTPAGLTPQVTRTSDTTATLTFTGNAAAHANANDISNFGVSFGSGAFSGGLQASAVTGAARADIVLDFADPANRAPTASGTTITTNEDSNKTDTLPLATDLDGDMVIYTKASDPAHGTVAVYNNGTYIYTPDHNYNGADSFTYTVSDGRGGSNTYTVDVTVNPVNDAPTASGTNITTDEDTVKSDRLPTALDVDGDTITYSKASDPGHGTVVVNGDGTYTYTPAANYNGSDSFTYTVSDDNGGSNTYTVTIIVSPVNDAPVGADDSITTNEDTSKSAWIPNVTDAENDPVVVSKASDPAHGTVLVLQSGYYTYTPAANYNGPDSFTYTISDGRGGSNTYTISVTVNPVNDAPTASGTSITINEDTVKSDRLPTALDVDGDTITYSKASDPGHGTVVVNGDGTYTYTPAANYNGVDSFTYTVSDGNGGSNTYTVAITVSPVNDAPVAANETITINEDTIKSGNLPAATDVDGNSITYSKAGNPAHGTVVINPDGTYLYVPATNYNGPDSFTYTVSDGNGGSNTYTITVNVVAVNDKPVASGTSITTDEDTVKSGTLPTATDVDGDTITYSKATDPAHGTLVVNGDGTYAYTPAANYNGVDSFTYTVSDGNGGSNTYTVAITVSPVNDAPVAFNDTITINEDTIKSGNLPAATDVDGDSITYSKATNPAHGTVVINTNGTYLYAPAANYNGPDSFTYTVSDGHGGSNTYTIAVTVNAAPVAANDTIVASKDTVKTGTLPAATDADGDAVTYAKATDPAHGTVVVNANGTYTYTPATNYSGADSFTYTVNDSKGGSNTYTVSITFNVAPVAANDTIITNTNAAKAGTLPAALDADGDAVTYAKATDPGHGTVLVNANGSYTYTPAFNYHGADSFTYTVSDGKGGSNTYTVAITVNDPPVAGNVGFTILEDTIKSGNLPAATDADGDSITYSKATNPAHGTVVINTNGTYLYVPAANYNGADSFTYTVSDGKGGSNTYSVSINVMPVNDNPVASGTTITTSEDTVKTGSLPTALDVDGDTITYSKAADPAHGTVVVNGDGTYTYTPAANYNGNDSFMYTVSDGNGGSNSYTVTIIVSPVNDAPVAANDTITINEDTIKSGNLPAATDVDGDSITYSKASNPAHGSVVINPNGTYLYAPAANYNGPDSFTYTVSDGKGGSNTYTVLVNVTPVNDAPTASGTVINTAEGIVKTGTLPVATDVDGDAVTYGKGSDPAHGTVKVNADGTYTYTPAATYNGTDSFTYTVSDGKGGSNIYTVAVTVTPAIITNEDIVKAGTLPAPTDIGSGPFTYVKGSDPSHGTVEVKTDGTYTYSPVANYNGTDSFTYTVSDAQGGSRTYTGVVIVTPVNDAPTASGTVINTAEGIVKAGTLPVATDVDGDTVTYGKGSDPAHGTVTVNTDGTYTYTPTAGYNGADSFTYTVSDGKDGSNTYTVEIAVSPAIVTNEDIVKAGILPAPTDIGSGPFTYGKGSDPSHGTVVVNTDGTYTYSPVADYNGTDSFTYTVSDAQGGSRTYTGAVIVSPVNDAPTASDTNITLDEDGTHVGNLPTANDVDGDKVTYTKATNPAHGTVVIEADGKYTYKPATDFHGTDSFTYTVSDGNNGSNIYTVEITVNPVNDAPTASNTKITLDEDGTHAGNLPTANDVDGDKVTYTKATNPAHGTVVIEADGKYTYKPATDFHGTDSFTYTVSDGNNGSNIYTVEITVNPVNDAPTASNTKITLDEDGTHAGNLPTANDVDGDKVTYTKATNPAHGTVVIEADGKYTYKPATDFHGTDSFTYTVSDGQGGSNTYTVAITVTPVNDAPVGSGTSITTSEDTVKTGTLPVATDVDGDTLTYGKGSDPAHGTVTVNPDGSYVYTPAANYNGADSFTYTVSDGQGGSNTYTVAITITPVNDAPTASGTSISTAEDTVKTGTLPLATDVDGDTVTYGKGSDPAHGTVVVNADGTYTYTPASNYNGADSFSYTVSDGQGGSNTYTVAITVTPINDAPVGSGTSITTSEDTVKTGTLPVATDVDGDTLTYGKGSDPAHGTVTVNPDGSYVYTPAANYNGADSFTYTVSDGQGGSNTYTVAITITPVNDAPTASGTSISTAEDTVKTGTLPAALDVDGDTVTYGKGSDPAHGTVVVNADGTYTYTPASNYNGADSFTYTVNDGQGGSNTYTVAITVTPVNDAPVGSGTSITTSEDTVKTGTLPVATDVDGDAVTYGKGSDPAHGTVVVNADGTYTYTPASNYNGADSFTYTVSDGQGGTNTYTVAISITPVNDAPTASGTSISTAEDTVKTGTLPLATDVDGDTVTYGKGSDPAHGTVTVNPNGSYVYTPAANYNGADSFTYTVNDGQGGSNTYTVNIVITPVNDAPVGSGTTITTAEDTVKTGTLPVALDVDGDTLTYGKGSDPAHGTVTVNPDGSYVYTPAANYNGADSFTYTVSDGQGGSNTYTVAITITAVNDAPVGSGTTITTAEDTVQTGTLPVALDVDGDTLTYGKGSDPAHGTVVVNADGTYIYTPASNYNGADSFTYTVSDGQGGSNTYTVAINITAVNDAPTASNGTASVDEDAVLSGNLPAVVDVDGDSATYAKASDPANGTVTVNANGSYVYTPAANYNGADSFSYTVSDGKGGSNTYTVNITVNPVNDAPVAPGNVPVPDTLSAGVAMPPLTVPAFTDIDNASLNYTATLANGGALPGWLVFDPATRTFSGTPASDAAGTYTVIVRASDGTASNTVSVDFSVLPLPPQPVAAPEPVAVPAPVVVEAPPVPAPLPVAALSPLPTFVPGTAIVDTRINPAEPVSTTGYDTLSQLDGRGIRAADMSNGEYRRAAEMSDLYTDNNGFRTVVAKAENPALMLFQGVPDQYTDNGRPLMVSIPNDAFVHTQADAVVRLAATLQDGRPLPSWVQFDAQTGKFTGEVPRGLVGELRIKLTARDINGHEATALFRINVGQAKNAMGKSGLSEQLRQASAVNAAYRVRA